MKRREAAGAEAYGTPRNPSTSRVKLPDRGIMIPRTLPYAVSTNLVLYHQKDRETIINILRTIRFLSQHIELNI